MHCKYREWSIEFSGNFLCFGINWVYASPEARTAQLGSTTYYRNLGLFLMMLRVRKNMNLTILIMANSIQN